MRVKWMTALLAPLLLSGCMMAGMAGMGGMGHMGAGAHKGSAAAAHGEPTVIKEMTGGEFRVTADFPPYAPTDSLRYTVTVRTLDGRLITTDAQVVMDVSPAATEAVAMVPAAAHAGHAAPTAKTASAGFEHIRFAPVERGGGRFVFRPSIPRGGAYRIAVTVERVGDTVLDPPIMLAHVVSLPALAAPPSASGHTTRTSGLATLAILGGVSMAVMMLLAMR